MCARNALSAVRRRQGAREMHSQAPGGGDMLTLCVPRCLTMAIFCPGVSRKWPRSGKGSLRGNISPPCIQNELALARYARHVSEKPRKSPLEDTSREDLARKGPFCCTNPSNHAWRADLAAINVRKALRTEVKRSWVSQAHFVLRPTAPPPWLRTSAAAVLDHGSCRSVAGGANP